MRKHLSAVVVLVAMLTSLLPVEAASPITRRDGFLLLWQSIRRPVSEKAGKGFDDLQDDAQAKVFAYAKARSILDVPDDNRFRPADALTLGDALVWLLRTRNVADPDEISVKTLSGFLLRYPLSISHGGSSSSSSRPTTGRLTRSRAPMDDAELSTPVTEEQLLALMRTLDAELVSEVHEISLYSEDFHGLNTAFDETFDMYAMTAAHRTFPYNTLVRVTEVDSGKSVTVRINDRGPFVKGRDMDLSLGAFLELAPRSRGVLHARFQRLGDANLVGPCTQPPAYQSRIGKMLRLLPGIPHTAKLGMPIVVRGSAPFVVRQVTYPDGNVSFVQDWIAVGETFQFTPSVEGDYDFQIATVEGRTRDMAVRVVGCGA